MRVSHIHEGNGALARLRMLAFLLASTAVIVPPVALAQGDDDSEEITVTARKRSESLQKVPIAVTAATGERLEQLGITNVLQLGSITPSFTVTQTVGFVSYFLRGVGSTITIPGSENPIATYVDGVYMARPTGALQQLPNVERVEVLRGPQGTLFGRNATGGLVNIITKQPSDVLTGKAMLSVGNGDVVEGNIYLSGPIADGVQANIMVAGRDQNGGFGKNLLSGADLYAWSFYNVRGALRFEFDPTFTATLGGYYNWFDSSVPGSTGIAPGARPSTANGGRFVNGQPAPPARFTTSPRDGYFNNEPLYRLIDYGASLTITKDWDGVTLTSISAYNKSYGIVGSDFDGTDASGWSIAFVPGGTNVAAPTRAPSPASYDFPYFYSQEIRLGSTDDGPFQWVVGVYGQWNEDAYNPIGVYNGSFQPSWEDRGKLNIPAFSNAQVGISSTEAYAAFGQATYDITEEFSITAGIRYNYESKEFTGRVYSVVNGVPNLLVSTNAEDSWSRPTWLISAAYDTGDTLFYASYNRGFRSGAYNTSAPTVTTPTDEEIIDAYEVGFKATLMDGMIRFNGAAYYYDYTNLQFLTISPTTGTAILQNAAGAEIKGIDLEVYANPIEGLNIYATLGLIDSEYTEFPNYVGRVPQLDSAGQPIGGVVNRVINVVGNPLIQTPEYTATLGFSYEHAIADSSAVLELAADVSFKGEAFMVPEQTISQPAYSWVNASVGVRIPVGDTIYRTTLWARNLTDEDVIISGSGNFNTLRVGYAEPLTFGIRFTVEH